MHSHMEHWVAREEAAGLLELVLAAGTAVVLQASGPGEHLEILWTDFAQSTAAVKQCVASCCTVATTQC